MESAQEIQRLCGWEMNRYLTCLLMPIFATRLDGQGAIMLRPSDAIELAETSKLFDSHYDKRGCPRADAAFDGDSDEIHLRLEDGCLGGASVWAGDFLVNRKTGQVRDSTNGKTMIARNDSAVGLLWKQIDATLLTDSEALYLVNQSASVKRWDRLGVSMKATVTSKEDAFLIDIVPASSSPAASDRVLRFHVDRREYRLYEGRFNAEDINNDVVAARDLLRSVKWPLELTEDDIINGVRQVPEVDTWLRADKCRGIRIEPDQNGITYYSVDLFRWCAGGRDESLAGLAVNKRSGAIMGVQAVPVQTHKIPTADFRLKDLGALKNEAKLRLDGMSTRAKKAYGR